jgi:Arc/MetJ-type ribon-helix-helix transcriptional regulator
MVRTQIYLTESETAALKALVSKTGKSQSELIREALDELIARLSHASRGDVLKRSAGIWKDRADLPDFRKQRLGLDRGHAQ